MVVCLIRTTSQFTYWGAIQTNPRDHSTTLASGRGRSAVRALESNHSRRNSRSTGGIRAVANAIVEVDILAKTRRILSIASKRRVLGQHVVETSLAARRQIGYRSRAGGGVHSRRGRRGPSGNGRRAVTAFKVKYTAGNSRPTGSVRAVADAVVEVDIAAETRWVRCTTSEAVVLGQHVVKAGLLGIGISCLYS